MFPALAVTLIEHLALSASFRALTLACVRVQSELFGAGLVTRLPHASTLIGVSDQRIGTFSSADWLGLFNTAAYSFAVKKEARFALLICIANKSSLLALAASGVEHIPFTAS